MFFLSPEINCFFSEIGNNPMRALGRKNTCFFGNELPKYNARAHLKQIKKNHSGLTSGHDIVLYLFYSTLRHMYDVYGIILYIM